MSLAAGTRLGAYEIVGLIGSGGMGEVYRARDTRLGREVAVKVLPPAFAGDADRLRRFEQEARAASQLNHPNIVTVFDVGSTSSPQVGSTSSPQVGSTSSPQVGSTGSPQVGSTGAPQVGSTASDAAAGPVFYLVEELLEGETLRARVASSPLPVRKAIDAAAQVADAIAAAHDKGIVHRDLKPDNIVLMRDGRVKVLDFGLAKLHEAQVAAAPDLPTIALTKTGEGIVLGTVGYMSPEQVRGRPTDARSDIFALGTILYEMVTGRRAFQRDSAPETMTAIVRDEPPPLEQSGVAAPPALARIIDHCLEKNPDERFQSARDLAFNLRALSDASGPRASQSGIGESPVARVSSPGRRNVVAAAIAVALLAAVGVGAFLAGQRSAAAPPLWFDKLTFRQGAVRGARFAPDGKSVIYSASWSGAPEQTFLAQPGNPESRALDLPSTRVLSISRSGELAVLVNPQPQGGFIFTGTLARVPAAGGAPRELLEKVEEADWGPDGDAMAVVRTVGGRGRLEFPIGNVLFETAGWIASPRVSPSGDAVAFIHHPLRGNDAGDIDVVDRNRRVTALSRGYLSAQGLAWAGDDVLFTAAPTGATRRLYAVPSHGGDRRLVAAGPGSLFVYDAAASGEVLLARVSDRIGLAVRTPSDARDREMSWLDWSLVRDMSSDGKVIVFDETGEGGGSVGSVYLRRTDGSPAVRLGDGGTPSLSPDGKWVASFQGDPARINILPTGVGQSRVVATRGIAPLAAQWFPDGRRLLVAGNEPGHALRAYLVPLDGGDPKAITPEGCHPFVRVISPDSRAVLTLGPDATYHLYPVDGGAPLPVNGIRPTELPLRMPTPETAYVYDRARLDLPVSLVDLKSGRRTPVLTIGARPPDDQPFVIRMSADGRTYAYSYFQTTSELFLMRKGEGR